MPTLRKKEMKFFVFSSPIGLNGNNFLVKAPLKKLLKFMEFQTPQICNARYKAKQICYDHR
jgi:hypothetical protein